MSKRYDYGPGATSTRRSSLPEVVRSVRESKQAAGMRFGFGRPPPPPTPRHVRPFWWSRPLAKAVVVEHYSATSSLALVLSVPPAAAPGRPTARSQRRLSPSGDES